MLQERAAVAELRRAAARRARPLAGGARGRGRGRGGRGCGAEAGAARRRAHAPHAPGDPGMTAAAPLHHGGAARLTPSPPRSDSARVNTPRVERCIFGNRIAENGFCR